MTTPKRGHLTKRQHATLLASQGGQCCVPGCTETRGLIGEHSTPSAWIGGKPDQLMCPAHHALKTPLDIKKIAKVKRILKRLTGARRARKKITNRGFDKRLRKKLDGTVEARS